MPTTKDTDFKARIQDLCERKRLTRAQLGKIVYGYTDDQNAANAGSRLAVEDRDWPGSVRLTIARLEDGTLDPEKELRRVDGM